MRGLSRKLCTLDLSDDQEGGVGMRSAGKAIKIKAPEPPRVRNLVGVPGTLGKQGHSVGLEMRRSEFKEIGQRGECARRDNIGLLGGERFYSLCLNLHIQPQFMRRLPEEGGLALVRFDQHYP